jgi:hypothetical protein
MATAAELRTEATRLRATLGGVRNPDETAAIETMIEELEERPREMDNGDAAND